LISNALEDKELPIYGDGMNVRDWIYVEDHCRALDLVLHQGKEGEVYNIGGQSEKTNLSVVKAILDRLGKPHSLMRFVTDRPGHDRRYAIDFSKIEKELDGDPRSHLKKGLADHLNGTHPSRMVEKGSRRRILEYYNACKRTVNLTRQMRHVI
jgi:dTDP-glucose 4,6-dehydratase